MGLGRRDWDVGLGRETRGRGTRGRGTRGRGTRGRGTRGCGTRGLVDARLGDVGLGEVGLENVGRRTQGLGDAWRLGDVINKPDFCAEIVKYNFRWSRERCNMLESLSVVADDFQRPWFGWICLLASLTVTTLGIE